MCSELRSKYPKLLDSFPLAELIEEVENVDGSDNPMEEVGGEPGSVVTGIER